jgi:8-oxo-dGTP pyrophosphatase MutT (NUDIX family)
MAQLSCKIYTYGKYNFEQYVLVRIGSFFMNLPEKSSKYQNWQNKIVDAGCRLENVEELSSQWKPGGELLFAYLDAAVRAPEGYQLPHILFLRGDAVVIVPRVINRQTRQERFLVVQQRRIADGAIHMEFPAGMVDSHGDDPRRTAQNELYEETGLCVQSEDLQLLHQKPLYSSPGASDEGIWFFGIRLEISNERYRSLPGSEHGKTDENERIRVDLVSDKTLIDNAASLQVLYGRELFMKREEFSVVSL